MYKCIVCGKLTFSSEYLPCCSGDCFSTYKSISPYDAYTTLTMKVNFCYHDRDKKYDICRIAPSGLDIAKFLEKTYSTRQNSNTKPQDNNTKPDTIEEQEVSRRGYIYILINKSIKFIKIGMTNRSPEERARELSNTSVPTPFEVFYSTEVADCSFLEKMLHDVFDEYRVNNSREFFDIKPDLAKKVLLLAVLAHEKES